MTSDPRAELIDAGRRLAAAGLSPGSSGNLSVRVGDRMVVTRRGADLAGLAEHDLVMVGLADGVVEASADETAPPAEPTKEAAMHAAAYRAGPSARAIVHVHSHYATAVSCLPPDARGDAGLPPYTPYRVMRLGRVALVPFAPPGSARLAALVGETALRTHAMLLAQHGSLIIASSLEQAVADAAELEAAARLTLELAGRNANLIDPTQLEGLRA